MTVKASIVGAARIRAAVWKLKSINENNWFNQKLILLNQTYKFDENVHMVDGLLLVDFHFVKLVC